ncbi:MAG: UvrB/UvrC motif-containing protein, partial [Oscillospiraceae bacterium]|nr:UvrB/UvrC motif-containing protein [Oscillospiraceae bacterium]
CYKTFREELMPLIQRIHGKTVHSGKIPESAEGSISLKNKIAELEKELKVAVDEQNFEKAVEIRDEIASLKKSL